MKPIDVLRGIDSFENPTRGNLCWQRQLHENAVDLISFIKLSDQSKQFLGRRLGGKLELFRIESEGLTGSDLASDIDLRCRVIPDDHRGQSRFYAQFLQLANPLRHTALDLFSDLHTIHYLRSHQITSFHRTYQTMKSLRS